MINLLNYQQKTSEEYGEFIFTKHSKYIKKKHKAIYDILKEDEFLRNMVGSVFKGLVDKYIFHETDAEEVIDNILFWSIPDNDYKLDEEQIKYIKSEIVKRCFRIELLIEDREYGRNNKLLHFNKFQLVKGLLVTERVYLGDYCMCILKAKSNKLVRKTRKIKNIDLPLFNPNNITDTDKAIYLQIAYFDLPKFDNNRRSKITEWHEYILSHPTSIKGRGYYNITKGDLIRASHIIEIMKSEIVITDDMIM